MGNVEYIASIIQDTVGGDLFQIETVEQYPLDHDPLVDQAAQEQVRMHVRSFPPISKI